MVSDTSTTTIPSLGQNNPGPATIRIGLLYINHPLVQKFYQDFRLAAQALLRSEGDVTPTITSNLWVEQLKQLLESPDMYCYENNAVLARRLPQFAERFNALGRQVNEAVRVEKQAFIDQLLAQKQAAGIACYVSCDYVFEFPGPLLASLARELDALLEREAVTGHELSFEEKERVTELEDGAGRAGSKGVLEYDNGLECGVCRGEMYGSYWDDCPSQAKHHHWHVRFDHHLTSTGWRNTIYQCWDATGKYQAGQNELAQQDYDWRQRYLTRSNEVRSERDRVAREALEARQNELRAFYAELDAGVATLTFKWGQLELALEPHPGRSATSQFKVKLYGLKGSEGLYGLRQVKIGRSSWYELTHLPTKARLDTLLGRTGQVGRQDLMRFIYLLLNVPGLEMGFTTLEAMSAQTKATVQKIAELLKEHQLPGQVGIGWPLPLV